MRLGSKIQRGNLLAGAKNPLWEWN